MKFISLLTRAILLIFTFTPGFAQNLVPNPGFETVITCPATFNQLPLALPWDTLSTSADLFNTCANNSFPCLSVDVPANFIGNASAHSGKGYAGIIAKSNIANYREYIQAPLTAPLLPGKIYKVEAWFRRASNSSYAVKTLGLTLSVGQLTQSGSSNLGFPPQVESTVVISDTSNWTLVSGFMVAAGGENNITIGNFRDDAAAEIVPIPNPSSLCPSATAYYYIDDVNVELVNEQLSINGDTLICPGTFTTLYANTNTVAWWSLATNPLVPVATNLSLTVNPTVNTTYILNGIFYKDSTMITVIASPIVSLRNDTTICEEQSVLLDASDNNSTYLWSTGEITPAINVGENKTYWVQVDNGGCIVSDTFNLTILTNPPIDLGIDTVYCPFNYDFITLNAGIGTGYQWTPTLDTTRTILITTPGTYTVTVDHANGCLKDTSITIKEVCQPKFYVPSSFTPNEDGLNDKLCSLGNSFETFQFMIFNRWGEIIFQSSNTSSCWDGTIKGKKAPIGVYAFSVDYTAINEFGLSEKGRNFGTVTLIR